MAEITRKPALAAKDTYDLIIIGGGIYGAMLALEAIRRGLYPLLVERDDFGEFTSSNSLRIIHGGFRYLQSLDLYRLRKSIAERRWFLQNFPNLVEPLPCLMPLYGKGLRRPFLLRMGLLAYEFLSYKPNQGVRSDRHILPGRIIDATQTREIFSDVDTEGLQGGAIWYDAFMPDSQRVLMEILRWACNYGATALNYVEAVQLLKDKKGIAGIIAIDHESGQYHEFRTNVVVNACGPWCRDIAARFDRDEPTLFRSMMAWNVLFNRKALVDYGLAVTPKSKGGRTYFLVPWKGMLLAGTGHAPWLSSEKKPIPSSEQIQKFLDDLNYAVPALGVCQNDILRIFPGLQSAAKAGGTEFAVRDVILNHVNHGGPNGLYSISGVKFTTARLVAEKTLNQIYPERKISEDVRRITPRPSSYAQNGRGIYPFDWYPVANDSKWKESLRSLIAEESVQHLDDLILRRTSLGDNPVRALKIGRLTGDLFEWDDLRFSKEIARLKEKLGGGKVKVSYIKEEC